TKEQTRSMKHYLRERGLGTAVWRLLSRSGTQWINEFLPYFDQDRQPLSECAIEIVQMATAFGTQHLPPQELLHALIQRLNDQFGLCKRLGALMARADGATMDLIKEQAMAIFQWGSDHAEEIPDAVMRRITLRGILRRVQAQALLDQKRHAKGRAWSVPYRLALQEPQLSAVVLDSPLAIWQEGQLMRHCADNFVTRCAKGHLLMVSLRDASQRHPLATVSFSMTTPNVQVHKFSGFANRRIADQTYDLIHECRRQLQRQRSSIAQEDGQLAA
ncbi:PcfJ domain-containing protein, partial [bacterium]|nr:PcfJ domain-containing protein [bacterium]